MAKAAASVLDRAPELDEWIDPALRAKEGWPTWRNAVTTAHNPLSADEVVLTAPARHRLAYDEVMAHQITLALQGLRQASDSLNSNSQVGDALAG